MRIGPVVWFAQYSVIAVSRQPSVSPAMRFVMSAPSKLSGIGMPALAQSVGNRSLSSTGAVMRPDCSPFLMMSGTRAAAS